MIIRFTDLLESRGRAFEALRACHSPHNLFNFFQFFLIHDPNIFQYKKHLGWFVQTFRISGSLINQTLNHQEVRIIHSGSHMKGKIPSFPARFCEHFHRRESHLWTSTGHLNWTPTPDTSSLALPGIFLQPSRVFCLWCFHFERAEEKSDVPLGGGSFSSPVRSCVLFWRIFRAVLPSVFGFYAASL